MSGQTPGLAERMQHIGLSPTMKGTIAAEKMRREGIDVVDLGAGEPDFPTPAHVTAAAHKALDANFTKYTANMGTLELREAIGFRYRETYGVSYAPDEVIATAGGKQALFHTAIYTASVVQNDLQKRIRGWTKNYLNWSCRRRI